MTEKAKTDAAGHMGPPRTVGKCDPDIKAVSEMSRTCGPIPSDEFREKLVREP